MQNQVMHDLLERGEAVDVSDCPRTPSGDYDLTSLDFDHPDQDKPWFNPDRRHRWLGVDFVDAKREVWILSIGRHRETGRIYGTTSGHHYYHHPAFECLHLR